MSETDIRRRIMLMSRGNVRLWRNNNGVLQDKHGGYVQFGLAPGSHDLIGLKSVVITPQMVGQRIAQFVSIEVKDPEKKTKKELLDAQRAWMAMIQDLGGLSCFAYDLKDAQELLEES
jgi:hypothetical protein